MVPQIPRTAIAGHVVTSISAALTAKILRIRQSMPDSKALNLVGGKSHSNKVRRVRPAWTYTRSLVSNTRHPRQASQSHQQGLLGVQAGRQVNCRKQGQGPHSDDEEEPRQPHTGGQKRFPPQVRMVNMIYATHIPKSERKMRSGTYMRWSQLPQSSTLGPAVRSPSIAGTTPLVSVMADSPHWS